MLKTIFYIIKFSEINGSLQITPDTLGHREFLAEYGSLAIACTKISESSEPDLKPCIQPGSELQLENGRSLTVTNPSGVGESGTAYLTSDPNLVVKVSFKEPLCKESSSMKLLRGLGGILPRVYPIVSDMSDWCRTRVIVMDKLGDTDYAAILQAGSMSDRYLRFASFLSAIDRLHKSGIVHGDLHPFNVRVKTDDPSFIAFIDLGQIETLLSEPSSNLPKRNDSLEEEESDILQFVPEDNVLMPQFTHALVSNIDHWPDLGRWIKEYRRLGRSLAAQSSAVDLNKARLFSKAQSVLPESPSKPCETIPDDFSFGFDGKKHFSGPLSDDGTYALYAVDNTREKERNMRKTQIAVFLSEHLGIKSKRVHPPPELPIECRRMVFFDKNYPVSLENILPFRLAGAVRLIVSLVERLHSAGIIFNNTFRQGLLFDRIGLPRIIAITDPTRLLLYIDPVTGQHSTHPEKTRKRDFMILMSELIAIVDSSQSEFITVLESLRRQLQLLPDQAAPDYQAWKDALDSL